MKRLISIYVFTIIVVSLFSSCASNGMAAIVADSSDSSGNAPSEIISLAGEDFYEQAQGGALIDVRSQKEYATGHITGAVSIPIDEIELAKGQYETDDKLFVYCKAGVRSDTAAEELITMGFKYVYTLDGGMDKYPPDESLEECIPCLYEINKEAADEDRGS
jgi:rhodanese-related sulfurtransferase